MWPISEVGVEPGSLAPKLRNPEQNFGLSESGHSMQNTSRFRGRSSWQSRLTGGQAPQSHLQPTDQSIFSCVDRCLAGVGLKSTTRRRCTIRPRSKRPTAATQSSSRLGDVAATEQRKCCHKQRLSLDCSTVWSIRSRKICSGYVLSSHRCYRRQSAGRRRAISWMQEKSGTFRRRSST